MHLPAHQHGRTSARGGHLGALERLGPGLALRLRFPALSRRADVLRRFRRGRPRLRNDEALPRGAHRLAGARSATGAAGARGRHLRRLERVLIFRSPYPDVVIPDISVVDYVLQRAPEFGEKAALIDGVTGTTLSYDELASGIRRAAGGLAQRGLAKGDVLAIYSPNTLYYPVAFHGAAYAGGVVTTVNPLYTSGELAKQLRDARARFLITAGPFVDKAREAAAEAGGIEKIFTFDGAPGTTPFSALLDSEELENPPQIDPATDLVALPYSSGTTGLSKGVMLTHRNLVANMAQLLGTRSLVRELKKDDTLIAVLPFFHIYGLLVIMTNALSRGAAIVVLPRFDLEQFLKAVQDYGVTFAHLVPPIVIALAKHPMVSEYDLSSIEGINSGAA
ncbi:MAG TPA: hypothetical protein EYO97_02835, partial [Gemmatimonadetes bacterium]|nr:hypothetical protein [Gemmatimonadota bacterium]